MIYHQISWNPTQILSKTTKCSYFSIQHLMKSSFYPMKLPILIIKTIKSQKCHHHHHHHHHHHQPGSLKCCDAARVSWPYWARGAPPVWSWTVARAPPTACHGYGPRVGPVRPQRQTKAVLNGMRNGDLMEFHEGLVGFNGNSWGFTGISWNFMRI